jgi:hypothetical protein
MTLFERKLRNAIVFLSQVQSLAEEQTFIFYTVPILSQLATALGYIDRNGEVYPGATLVMRFPHGTYSLELVLDDRPAPTAASGREIEKGYFQPSDTSGRIGIRLQSGIATENDQALSSVLYHETIHLYGYLLRRNLWFSSGRTRRDLTAGTRQSLDLTRYATEKAAVEAQLLVLMPIVNRARRSRGVRSLMSAADARAWASSLLDEAVVRAETSFFESVRSTGPGRRGEGHRMELRGSGYSIVQSYLFRFGDKLTPDDERALSSNTDAQNAIERISVTLGGVNDTHFGNRWSPSGSEQNLPERTPMLYPGFRQ